MVWYNGTICTDNRRFNPGRFPRIYLDHEQLRHLYLAEEKPVKVIADELNCSVPTVKRNLKVCIEKKYRRKNWRWSIHNSRNKEIKRLYEEEFKTTESIGRIVGLSAEAVRMRLAKMDVERRRNFKDLIKSHPSSFNRTIKKYKIKDTQELNFQILKLYCLFKTQSQIARLLGLDRQTVKRRIDFMKKVLKIYFYVRLCKRCTNYYRTQYKHSKVCPKCYKGRMFIFPQLKKSHL